jgi:predicted alpha/beta hydrolase family esterase
MTKVLFLHGLDTDVVDREAMYLSTRYATRAPNLMTGTLSSLKLKYGEWKHIDSDELLAAIQKPMDETIKTISEFDPDVIVGASFGAALLAHLIEEGFWSGPSVFLASTATLLLGYESLSQVIPSVWIHGRQDGIVPAEHSIRMAGKSGGELILVNDKHRLRSLTETGLLDWAIEFAHRLGMSRQAESTASAATSGSYQQSLVGIPSP